MERRPPAAAAGAAGGPRGWRSPDAAPVAARSLTRPVTGTRRTGWRRQTARRTRPRADGQPGLLTGCGSLALPVRHRGNLRHPLPRPDPAPDIPNAPNTTLMVESQAQSVGTRHRPGNMARCQAEAHTCSKGTKHFWCDLYRMSIARSTAAASKIASRSAPRGQIQVSPASVVAELL